MPVLRHVGRTEGHLVALDGLRKVLHLILLLMLFGVLLAASQTEIPFVPDSAALVLAPNGYLVEEYSGDPIERALSKRPAKTAAKRGCATSSTSSTCARRRPNPGLVLDLGGLDGAGLPMLQDLARSIALVPRVGQESLRLRPGLIAAPVLPRGAGRRGLPRSDGLCAARRLFGYYRTYFRGTLDKLAVDVNLFKVGSHKTAPEDWTRTDMSPEDREEREGLDRRAVGQLQGGRRRRPASWNRD